MRYAGPVEAGEFTEERFFGAIAGSGARVLLIGRRAMVALGIYFIVFFASAFYLSARHRLGESRAWLWVALLSLPLPWVAVELGWVVAEYGRQPWIIYGVLRTSQGYSPNVSAGEVIFTLLGFTGIYIVLGLLFVFLLLKMIAQGPEEGPDGPGQPLPVVEPSRQEVLV